MGFQATVEDEPDLTIPEETFLKMRLIEVTPKEINWEKNGEKKSTTLLAWWFEVTEHGKFLGRKVKGETTSKLTNREDNQFRNWAEALLARKLPLGMSVDVDDLIGMEASVAVEHRRGKGSDKRVFEEVAYVTELDENERQTDEPPF